jgi:hypothetical protein
MPQSIAAPQTYYFRTSRRAFLAVGGASLFVSACSKEAKQADGDWAVSGTQTKPINHDAWDKILASYVSASEDGVNRVDYKSLKTNAADELSAYLQALEAVPISQYPRNEQFAYWVNLYNAATVRVIIDHYPVKSIRDIGLLGQGPWKDKILRVEGKSLSLDDIEHGILRPIWKDVRVHYAVNCASIGCPNLALKAYRGGTVELMLDEGARAYINHSRGFDRVDGQLVVSNIFEWYQSDWGSEEDVLRHARKYATNKTAAHINGAKAIDVYDYNWSLNDRG